MNLEFGGRGTEEVEAEVISEFTSRALNPCVAKMTKGPSAGGGERLELEAGNGEGSEWVLTAGPSLPFLRLHRCLQSPALRLAGCVSWASWIWFPHLENRVMTIFAHGTALCAYESAY